MCRGVGGRNGRVDSWRWVWLLFRMMVGFGMERIIARLS